LSEAGNRVESGLFVTQLERIFVDIIRYEEKRLLNIEAAAQLLADARTIQEVAEVRNYAEAVRLVARQAKAGLEVQNQAAEIKLRAERRAGEMLAEIERITPEEKGALLNHDGVTRNHRGYMDTLKETDIPRTTAHNWQQIAAIPEPEFEQHIEETKAAKRELTTSGTVRVAKQLRRESLRDEMAANGNGAPDEGDLWQVYQSDIAQALTYIEPESVDVIITDPPYSRGYLPLYETLARVSSQILKPGGSLLVMCGQSYLPDIFNLMCPFMRYQWTLAYLTLGGQAAQLWDRNINTFWKPVLWFVNGEYKGKWNGDVLKSAVNNNDKRFHSWGQSVSGMLDIVTRFSNPGDIILDPFCGAGTTGVAAIREGRSFIGFDIDPEQIAITKGRLHDTASQT